MIKVSKEIGPIP